MKSFKSFLISEALHPEVEKVIRGPASSTKLKNLHKAFKDLTAKQVRAGAGGRIPKGSSRAYIKLYDNHRAMVDGISTRLKTGFKTTIRAGLDRWHDNKKHDGMSLGQMQNDVENNDHFVNSNYRILVHKGKQKDLFGHEYDSFETNKESGIFPPLFDHDSEKNNWAHVGHTYNLHDDYSKKVGRRFKDLTKTESHPDGITHDQFMTALTRAHIRNNGKWRDRFPEQEKETDHVEQHPLVQKFLDHQGNFDHPPTDYSQLQNLGIWIHPHDGSRHIVARDHAFNRDVSEAYRAAREKARDEGNYDY